MGILGIFLLNELSMRQYSLKETGKFSNQILPFLNAQIGTTTNEDTAAISILPLIEKPATHILNRKASIFLPNLRQ